MKGFVCGVCGFISINGSAPEKCPVCGSDKKEFKFDATAISEAKDELVPNESHIPFVELDKKCGFVENCGVDINVKIGKNLHTMEKDHFIKHIDFYMDNEFLSRVMFTPEKIFPAVKLHLKFQKGTLSVVALSNIHGAWITETQI